MMLTLRNMNSDDDELILILLPTAYEDEAVSSPHMLSKKQKTHQISRQWHQNIPEHWKKRLTMANLVLMAMFCATMDENMMFWNVFLTGRPCQEQEPVVDEGKPGPGGTSQCYQGKLQKDRQGQGINTIDGQTSNKVEELVEGGEGGWRKIFQKSRWDNKMIREQQNDT